MYIINADDFGSSPQVNAAILRCFQEGWVSSATIMANMPGFDEACRMIAEHNLRDHVGLHLVLTEGVPLTDRIKRQRRFCNKEGLFCTTRKTHIFHLDRGEREAVAGELRRQILRCREAGLKLTHLDSHHHIHEEIGILSQVFPLLREFGIPYVRIMSNLWTSFSRARKTYAALYNTLLRGCGLGRTDYFGSLDQYATLVLRRPAGLPEGKSFELMTHPVVDEQGVIRDRLSGRPLRQLTAQTGLGRRGRSFSGALYPVGAETGPEKPRDTLTRPPR